MELLPLAIASSIPLIQIRTDDTVYIEEVLSFIADGPVVPLKLPPIIEDGKAPPKFPDARVMYTFSDCKSLNVLYKMAVDQDRTIVFINTTPSPLPLDCGVMIPPKELVRKFVSEKNVVSDEELELVLPALGGLTLKDIAEIMTMTMTRDESLTARGINETRRGYSKVQGITQVDTDQDYYVCPSELNVWMDANAPFFINPKHPSLIPRGSLFDGPPGTGKTLASKYIAQVFGVPLYRLDLGGMMGKYVGESEGNLNAALSQINQVEPCVVIWDEVEKVFQGGNGGQSDTGVASRMLSQILWWLQEHKSKVFTVMTTNDKSKIPPELYREGRIDNVLQFLGISNIQEAFDFAKGSFDSVLEGLQCVAKDNDYFWLMEDVKALFSGATHVPQGKLTATAHSRVKIALTSGSPEVKATGLLKKAPLKIGKPSPAVTSTLQ